MFVSCNWTGTFFTVMLLKDTFTALILLFSSYAYSQEMSYEDVLQKAVAHRQAQNAAHVILWNTEHFFESHPAFADTWAAVRYYPNTVKFEEV